MRIVKHKTYFLLLSSPLPFYFIQKLSILEYVRFMVKYLNLNFRLYYLMLI